MNPNCTKYKSNKQEKRVAREINGRTQIASGSIDLFKGDVRSDIILAECKTTEKDRYVLSYKTWLKINREALKDGMRAPVMCIDLESGKHRYAIVDYNTWIDYMSWLPVSHVIDHEWKSTNKNSAQIKYQGDDNHSMKLVFQDVFVLEGNRRKDIELLITSWDTFLTYLKSIEK